MHTGNSRQLFDMMMVVPPDYKQINDLFKECSFSKEELADVEIPTFEEEKRQEEKEITKKIYELFLPSTNDK